MLKPWNLDYIWCTKYSRSIRSSPQALGWITKSGWGLLQSFYFFIFQKNWKINLWCLYLATPEPKIKSLLLRVALEHRFGIKDLRRGIRFYPSDYLEDSSDPETEKTSFLGKIPEKWYNWIRHTNCTRNNFRNKTRDVRLFIQCSRGSLLFGESALLHLWLHLWMPPWTLPWMRPWNMHCWITGSPSVSPLAAIKGEGEAFARTKNCLAAMAYPWCSCSRPPEVCVVFSSKRC